MSDTERIYMIEELIDLKLIQVGMTRSKVDVVFGRPDRIWHNHVFGVPPRVWSYGDVHFLFAAKAEDGLLWIYHESNGNFTNILQ